MPRRGRRGPAEACTLPGVPWLIACAAILFVAATILAITTLRRTPKSDPWRWRVLLYPQVTLILFILALAYDGRFSRGPVTDLLAHGGDKLGHLILFGMLALATHYATRGRAMRLGPVRLPLAIVLPLTFATVEEALQALSPHRTADPVDLLCDVIGMVLFWRLGVRLTRRSSGPTPAAPTPESPHARA